MDSIKLIVKNYKNNKYIELTEDKLILHRFWGRRTLELKKIRAAYMDNNNYISIIYGNRVITYGAIKVKLEDENIVEEIIEKLNVEKTVFCPDKNEARGSLIVVLSIWGTNMIINNYSGSFIFRLFGGVIILTCIISFFYYFYYRRVLIYDYENNIIKITGIGSRIKKYVPGSENYKLIEHKTMHCICTFKGNKNNNLIIHTDIRYPKYYRENLKELYKVSNSKEVVS